MTTQVAQELKAPMLQCLKRITMELAERLCEINSSVEEKSGIGLGMGIVYVEEKSEDDFRIKVKGNTHSGRVTEELFQVSWKDHTCPTYFHLQRWERGSLGQQGYDFHYCGMVKPSSNDLAKEIAIYTHHMQISGVLSRLE